MKSAKRSGSWRNRVEIVGQKGTLSGTTADLIAGHGGKHRFVVAMGRERPMCESLKFWRFSEDHHDRALPLTFRTYRILPHANSYFRSLYSYLDLLQ